MAFNVQEFRGQMKYDGARPNLFRCSVAFPTARGANMGGEATRKMTFMARAAQLPGSTVNQVPQFYFGRELKFAGNRQFTEWTVTIINDEDFVIRDGFERWMDGMNSHVSNLRNPEMARANSLGASYQQDGDVIQFGKDGSVLKKYKFVGMFPIDLSPIELDWGANDTIEEYSVTFAYQWWEWADGENGPTTDTLETSVTITDTEV